MAGESGTEIREITVTLSRSTRSFSMDVRGFTEKPRDVEEVDSVDDTVLYLEIEGDETMDEYLEEATVVFTLSKSDLDARGTSPENVALYRYHNGTWEQLETSLLRENDGRYVMEATTPGTSYFAVGIRQPVLSVSDISTDTNVVVDETTSLSADVTNTGRADGNVTVDLTVDGDVVSNQTVAVASGESQTVTFDYRFDTAGTYVVTIGESSTEVVVGEPNPTLSLADLKADATTIGPGESVTLIATVTNTGDQEGTYTLTFEAFDSVVETRTVSVSGGQTEVVTFEQTIDSPGEYTLTVNGEAITVNVEEGKSKFGTTVPERTGQDDPTESSGLNYGLLAIMWVLVVIVIAAVGIRHRSRDR
ncbi:MULTISPECIES: PGF-pre-PGF domain-containing protein [Haloferax]|nr:MULTISPECIES: PGF-pre-PGF domain-containing protein [Haloferax]